MDISGEAVSRLDALVLRLPIGCNMSIMISGLAQHAEGDIGEYIVLFLTVHLVIMVWIASRSPFTPFVALSGRLESIYVTRQRYQQ